MTIQEQLEKIIEKRRWLRAAQVLIKEESPGGFVSDLATDILSAMKIDEDKLKEVIRNSPVTSAGAEADIAKAIASCAQEIIRFEEGK